MRIRNLVGLTLLLLGASISTFAGTTTTKAPEMDANSALTALALLSGGLLVLRARRRRQ